MKKITGISLIAKERERQINEEGYSPEHDDEHVRNELGLAAACYAASTYLERAVELVGVYDELDLDHPDMWPWDPEHWKPTPENRIRELVKAGALIVAEIERLQRLEDKQ